MHALQKKRLASNPMSDLLESSNRQHQKYPNAELRSSRAPGKYKRIAMECIRKGVPGVKEECSVQERRRRRIGRLCVSEGRIILILQVHTHGVVVAKGLAAIRAFALAINETVLDAAVAENVSACFDNGVLEGVLAYLTLEHSLRAQLIPRGN